MRDQSKVLWTGAGVGVLLMVMAVRTPPRLSLATTALGQDTAAEQTASSGGDVGTEPAAHQSLLRYYFNALGWFYTIAFLLLSFVLVALVVMNLLTLRRQSVAPVDLMQNFEALLNEKRHQEAYELAKNDGSSLGRVLAASLAHLQDGYAKAVEAMQEVGDDEHMRLKHRLSYVGLLGVISLLVGLLGTVSGLVQSFQAFARTTTQGALSELSQEISTALITTLVGLWLAIPATVIFGILCNRLARLMLEVRISSERLMSRFHNVGSKKPAAPAAQQA